MTSHIQPLVVLVGATATGKSTLAVDLARELGGEVINADSMQFYRGMDIGTAKVTPAEKGGIAHHLIDVLELHQEASVAEFQAQSRQLINEIRGRGHIPILTGGSGLYVRAAVDVLEFPPTDPAVRERLRMRAEEVGADVLHRELEQVDPISAARIGDVRRIIRALEVHQLTGRTFSSYMPQRVYEPQLVPVVQLGLRIPRPALHQRVQARVHRMLQQGLLDEVRQLEVEGLREAPTASRAIGYPQMMDVLAGAATESEAMEATIVATRKFARRQETWFQADDRVRWLDYDDPQLVNTAMNLIQDQ